jgi:hypothetical protein
MTNLNTEWMRSELEYASFGDRRLDTRFKLMMDDFMKTPEAPINQASGDSAKAKAAYRFLQNDLVATDKILASHRRRTAQRAACHKTVLCVQDTTAANFSKHAAAEGLGPLGCSAKNKDPVGVFVHTAYFFSPNGTPLGFGSQRIWARKNQRREPAGTKAMRLRRTPIKEKESYRWIQAMEEAREFLPERTRLVQIADREADMFEFMHACMNQGSSFVVRARHDRHIDLDDEVERLTETFVDACPLGSQVVEVRGNGQRKARLATVEIYSRRFTLSAPVSSRELAALTGHDVPPPLDLEAVWAVEKDKPDGERISWLLLTDLNAASFDAAQEIVTWYTRRWRIEEFHKLLKTGCRIEDCRLEESDRLANYIASMSIVAHRLCELTFAQREDPSAPCTVVLTEDEWRVLFVRKNMGKPLPLPNQPPSLREATRWIAQLGGFLGRKGDGEPGIITLWRGWQVFAESYATWKAIQEFDLLS